MYVNAGELNKRISIYRKPDLEEDGYLPDSPSPALVHSCWAKFTQTSGTELVKNNADFGETNVRFLIRYTGKEIDRKMYVRYKDKNYEILYVNTYGDSREYMEIWGKWMDNRGGQDAGRQDQGGG